MANAQIVLNTMVVHNVAVLIADACGLTVHYAEEFQGP